MKRVSDEMRNLPQALPRPELRARILASLPDAPPQQARQRMTYGRTAPTMRLSFAGAMCGLLLLGAWALGHNHAASPDTGDGLQSLTHLAPGAPLAANSPRTSGNEQRSSSESGNRSQIGPMPGGSPSVSLPNAGRQPDQEIYTDPTSIAANKIMNEHVDEVDRAVRLARQEFERRQRMADAVKVKEQPLTPKIGSTSLQLAVAEIPDAQDRLRQIIQHLGGSISVSDAAQNGVESSSVTELNSSVNTSGSPVSASTVTIRIPASEVSRFESVLHQIGVVSPLKSISSAVTPQPTQGWSSMDDGKMKYHRPIPLRAEEIDPRHSGTALKFPESVLLPPVEQTAGSTVLYTIKIHSGASGTR